MTRLLLRALSRALARSSSPRRPANALANTRANTPANTRANHLADHVAVVANAFVIREVNFTDTHTFLGSTSVHAVAQQKVRRPIS